MASKSGWGAGGRAALRYAGLYFKSCVYPEFDYSNHLQPGPITVNSHLDLLQQPPNSSPSFRPGFPQSLHVTTRRSLLRTFQRLCVSLGVKAGTLTVISTAPCVLLSIRLQTAPWFFLLQSRWLPAMLPERLLSQITAVCLVSALPSGLCSEAFPRISVLPHPHISHFPPCFPDTCHYPQTLRY